MNTGIQHKLFNISIANKQNIEGYPIERGKENEH